MMYNKRVQLFLRFWEQVENRFLYKVFFILLMGGQGVLIAAFYFLLALISNTYQDKGLVFMLLSSIGFIIGVALSPWQYRLSAKKYREYIEFMHHELKKSTKSS